MGFDGAKVDQLVNCLLFFIWWTILLLDRATGLSGRALHTAVPSTTTTTTINTIEEQPNKVLQSECARRSQIMSLLQDEVADWLVGWFAHSLASRRGACFVLSLLVSAAIAACDTTLRKQAKESQSGIVCLCVY